jgi:ATP adenylyltransferase
LTPKPERLWAPWRYEYIKSTVGTDIGCFLCEAISANDDDDRLIIFRGSHTFVILNKYPYSNGHLLIVPNRHVNTLNELDNIEHNTLFDLVRTTTLWLDQSYLPQGYNIGLNLGKAAGAGLPGHLHVHVVPRWEGDTNSMPVLAGVKVISESLNVTYSKLKESVKLWEDSIESK